MTVDRCAEQWAGVRPGGSGRGPGAAGSFRSDRPTDVEADTRHPGERVLLPGRIARRDALRALLATAMVGSPARFAHATSAPSGTGPVGSFYDNFKGTRLRDQEGRPFDAASLQGRLVLVHFIFTACSTVCPPQTWALAEMQRQLPASLRGRVHLLSVSLDPLGDTPQTLKRFAQRMGADLSGWTFATGRPQDVERIADALRLFRPEKDVRKPDDHGTALWLVDPKGELRMRYNGAAPDVSRLLRELAALDALARGAAQS
jgi:protein SCO1/2